MSDDNEYTAPKPCKYGLDHEWLCVREVGYVTNFGNGNAVTRQHRCVNCGEWAFGD